MSVKIPFISLCLCYYVCLIAFVEVEAFVLLPSNETYWRDREALVEEDLNMMLGHDIVLSTEEEAVNDILMALKNEEMDRGFETLDFLAAKPYVQSKPEIDQSPVFQFIQKMPKGAILHIHDMAMTSVEWVISELTYWDDLYMCYSVNDSTLFRFFDIPDDSCNWVLVAEERANYSSPEDFDAFLFSKLSLFDPDIENLYPDINSIWEAFQHIFDAMNGLVMYRKAWEAYLYRALEEFMSDNVSYLEFRGVLPLLYEKSGQEYTEMESFAFYDNVIQNFTSLNSDRFFGVRFIYAPPRIVTEERVWLYVDLMSRLKTSFPSTVAGFDLVGQEDLGQPLTAFIEPFLTLAASNPSIPFFFHAGETNWEGMSTDGNLYDALLLNTTRIGHGYAIAKHPKLMQVAREKDVAVEICPLSNQILRLVEDLRNHPGSELAAASFPLVVSTDDPAIWDATLSHDFYEFFMAIGGAKADLKFLKKLALNSIKYSSLEDELKTAYQTLWESQWQEFIQSQIQKSIIIPNSDLENNLL